MKKSILTMAALCAGLSAALLSGCGGKKSDAQSVSSEAETVQSESETQEDVVELVESAPTGAEEGVPTGTGDPQELRTNKVSVGRLTVNGSKSTYEGERFTTEFFTDDFTVDDETETDVVTFYYMGDAAHEPYVRFEYMEGADEGELKDEVRLMEGDHAIDATSQMAITSAPVTNIEIQKIADDGLKDYYVYYIFKYGTGCVKITATTYSDDSDEDSTMAISDAIAMIFDSLKFKEEADTETAAADTPAVEAAVTEAAVTEAVTK